ncbi:hypothetical protein GCM10010377_01480 [Streptomyces viridiviolaceus]|uniref:Uncharacterized protein n=1 Tax=Streptomyces viridiviolaceus TaxID=68282 RepID=A0ABW2E0N9_9ACTN|nr:hypothetical protein [Streptomyces viridiviolaceus]GHB15765.1 hypothetical protein GCM10010377_01480 [Streptomyces viridiviolaceus]
MNPQNHPQRPSDIRPLHKRKSLWAVGAALFALGAFGGSLSAQDEVNATQALAAKPAPTVTTTATVTATPKPEPVPTVTKTKKVTTPGPTVTVTKTARAAGSGTSDSAGSSSDSGSGSCSIVSNAGNCYQAGQYCRNSDHGATTTTARGTRITCTYSSNAWRWTYS